MNPLRARVAMLFVLAALVPVVVSVIVWTGATRWGEADAQDAVALAAEALARPARQGTDAVDALCRDDLVVDRLMESLSESEPSGLDFQRLFDAKIRVAGLQALWLLDARSGQELVRVGEASKARATEPSLHEQARVAKGPFLISLGRGEPRFVGYTCTIERAGSAITVIGAHSIAELRSPDRDRIALRAEARASEVPLWEISTTAGTPMVFVFRTTSRTAPPLLIWVLVVGAVALGLALIAGGYLSRWLESGVEELTQAATRIGGGNLATTVREGNAGPFRATATAFNRMTRDLRDAQEQLRQTERVAAWQDIAKRLAHELKNPLSPIRLSIETLRKAHARSHDEFNALFDETTTTILQEVDRLRHIVDEFSRFARLPSPTLQEHDVTEIVGQVVSLYAEGSVGVEAELPDAAVIAAVDAEQITQVLHNLVQNARDAALEPHAGRHGLVRVKLGQTAREARIEVEDNGPGIPPDVQTAIFEPYYTGKKEGSGLGLAISSRIVTEHGGRIEVASKPGRTIFTVAIPLSGT